MSGSSNHDYGYYYGASSSSYQGHAEQQWTQWQMEQHAHDYQRYTQQCYNNSISHHQNAETVNQEYLMPPPRYTSRQFYQRRYSGSHTRTPESNFANSAKPRKQSFGKRVRSDARNFVEPKTKSSRKKKKPLSQNVPNVRSWTPEQALTAFNIEREYNKRSNDHSLIIRFPDLTLNKEIVSKFHPAIENVHFQQPSTPRYCYVTLDDKADVASVISTLNMQKFGEGFLSAEYKRDREEEQNLGPEDIDPLTLYVGNLAQDILKQDLDRIYPRAKRIDMGFAKKMKFTRYAFVAFKSVDDCVEAFKNTHNTGLYSRSLIVRFRRLHGTVGMPGETKPQNATTISPEKVLNEEDNMFLTSEVTANGSGIGDEDKIEDTSPVNECVSVNDLDSENIAGVNCDVDLTLVKDEPEFYYDHDDVMEFTYEPSASALDEKPPLKAELIDTSELTNRRELFGLHKPLIEAKIEPKSEADLDENRTVENFAKQQNLVDSTSNTPDLPPKTEPVEYDRYISGNEYNEQENDLEEDRDDDDMPNFTELYNNLINHKNKLSHLKSLTSD